MAGKGRSRTARISWTNPTDREQRIKDYVDLVSSLTWQRQGSFLAATVGPAGDWPGEVAFTSAHVESLRVLAAGGADLACIDSWTLALVAHEEPGLVSELHRVGVGPLIPSPAITVAATVDPVAAAELATAFSAATADPALDDALAALRITGFERTTLEDYLPTLDLAVFPL